MVNSYKQDDIRKGERKDVSGSYMVTGFVAQI